LLGSGRTNFDAATCGGFAVDSDLQPLCPAIAKNEMSNPLMATGIDVHGLFILMLSINQQDPGHPSVESGVF